MTTSKLEKIIDSIVFSGLYLAEKLPFRLLRVVGIMAGGVWGLVMFALVSPLIIARVFIMIWDDVRMRK